MAPSKPTPPATRRPVILAWWAWAYMTVVVSLVAFSAHAYALTLLPVSTVAT
jgi:drug/metabolite transporter (DMT)-like permease